VREGFEGGQGYLTCAVAHGRQLSVLFRADVFAVAGLQGDPRASIHDVELGVGLAASGRHKDDRISPSWKRLGVRSPKTSTVYLSAPLEQAPSSLI